MASFWATAMNGFSISRYVKRETPTETAGRAAIARRSNGRGPEREEPLVADPRSG